LSGGAGAGAAPSAAAPAGTPPSPLPRDPDALADRVLSGDARALARALTWVEDGGERAARLLDRLYPRVGRAHRVGITGPPGAGKSTLTAALTERLRARGLTCGIVCVDPTSPFTGGALLGDRIRMGAVADDPGVFIRSMATRGSLGGLARHTGEACDVLDAAGRDVVLIETVGVGQSEVEVARAADTAVVVLSPEGGDAVQAMKAGLMEIADIFCVNKADRPGADKMVRAIAAMLELGDAGSGVRARGAGEAHPAAAPVSVDVDARADDRAPVHADSHAAHGREGDDPGGADADTDAHLGDPAALWVPVLATQAHTGRGVDALAEAVLAHRQRLADGGGLAERRRARADDAVRARVRERLWALLVEALGGDEARLAAEVGRVARGEATPIRVAERLTAALAARRSTAPPEPPGPREHSPP
jgi:LAO/AO transport system kinase